MARRYFVYIVASFSRMLYAGSTSALEQRVLQHKRKEIPGYTAKYNIHRLVWFDWTNRPHEAVQFERRIKGWTRAKKIALVESMNPGWRDYAVDWGWTRRAVSGLDEDPSLRSG